MVYGKRGWSLANIYAKLKGKRAKSTNNNIRFYPKC